MRSVLAAVALLALAGVAGAQAQSYPTRAVTIVVPFAAGGPADITGRIVADQFARARAAVRHRERRRRRRHHRHDARRARQSRRLHARARPHGHARRRGRALSQSRLQAGRGFRADRAHRRAARSCWRCARTCRRTRCRSSSPMRRRTRASSTWRMPASARCRMGCLLLNAAIGIKPTMVPFTGAAPAMNALIAGQVDYVCDPILGPLPHVRAARSRRSPSPPASAMRACRTCRPRPKAACRSSTPRRSTPCSRPRARRSRSSTAWPTLEQGLNEDMARKRCSTSSAPRSPSQAGAARSRCALVKSEIARLPHHFTPPEVGRHLPAATLPPARTQP